jgi:hypothetical protein
MIRNSFFRHSLQVLILILLGLIGASVSQAQRSGSTGSGGRTPERIQREARGVGPAAAKPECPTPRGAYFFGYAFSANAAPRHGGAETEKAGLTFLAYFTCRASIVITSDNVLSTKTALGDRVTGLGDTTLYLGYDALSDKPGRPAISFSYGIKVPTASSTKGLGSGEVDHTIIATVSKSFNNDRAYLELNGGDYIAGRTGASRFDHFPFASGLLKHSIGKNDRYKLHFEVGGDFATNKSNAGMYSLNYLETRLSRRTAQTYVGLRIGAKFGLTPNVSRAGLYFALAIKGNLRNVFH